MNEVVVGLDGSPDSRRALRWAATVAQAAGVPLRAVEAWVEPPMTAVPGWPELLPPAEMDASTVQQIEAEVRDVLGAIPDFVRAEALRGPAAGAILGSVGPDSLLVLGGRGRGGFVGLLLGSVSRECIEHAPCPVVIPREDGPPDPAAVILVGTDGSENAALAETWAAFMGELCGAPVVAVHVRQDASAPRLAPVTVEEWIADGSRQAGAVETVGEPRRELAELAARMGAQLVVVGRRGTSRLKGLRTGGVSSYLVGNCPTTVAVIPPPAEPS